MNPETRALLTEALPLLRDPAVIDLVATALVSGASSFGDLVHQRRSLSSVEDPLGYWTWYLLMSFHSAARTTTLSFALGALQNEVDAARKAQHIAAK